ncbi:MAG TPA: ABC transporter permease [Thermoanaerobaculia bacterium]|jgi:putative ABC transport system permease protein|nr:ABC transporter permease [Thermoanaerobaculia bacterium]
MRSLLQDLRFAGRLLVRSPGLSLVIILTLALGIGANAAIFSVVNGVLLSPLPYPQSDRLMSIYSQFPGLGFDRFWVSAPELIEFRERATRFDGVGAYRTVEVNLEGQDQPLRVQAAVVSAGLFTVLGVHPERGRVFTPQEDLPNAEKVIVLGDGLWRRAFGGDSGIVGRRVKVSGQQRTILGVMPPKFDIAGEHVEAWIPLAIDPANPGGRGSHSLFLVGRLRSGANLAQAQSELQGLLVRWKQERPQGHSLDPEQHRLVIKPLLDDLVGDVRPKVVMLAFAVGLVLLIACLNVANLLLARAESRQREIAIRTALGAPRRRLIRQFLTESVLLSVLGGVCGLLLAVAGVRAMVALNADSIPRVESIGVDGRVVAFTLALAVLTGLLFGLAPALHARGGSFFTVLREGAQRGTAGRLSQWFRRGLVVAEIALASLLVIGAGLLLKSFWVLQQVNPGFEPRNVLSMQISLPRASYPDDPQVAGFYRKLTAQAASLPGVESVAAVAGLPPKRDVNANDTEFESIKPTKDGPPQNVDYWQFVTRDYFKTMRIRLIAGRTFTTGDDRGTPGVVVINQTMAKVFWPTRSPLGDRVRVPSGPGGPQSPWLTVVGVVADVKQGGLDQKTGTELYFLEDQAGETAGGAARTMYLVARTVARKQGDPMSLAAALRETIRGLDPSLPVAQVRPMDKVLFDSVGRPRFIMILVMLFAAVALVLAAVGTYGVLSYAVEQRTREIGVRMALGAQVGEVLGMILAQGALLAGVGLLLGVAGAVALRSVLASLLFGVTPTDPLIFAVVVALLALVSFVACFFPAQRAARVDPLVALRSE